MVTAKYYKQLGDNMVQCKLCPNNCVLKDGELSLCFGRKNEGGTLYAVNYGEVVSMHMDPMEKKPLYHFHPGKYILSVAPNGCNMRCPYCQNWEITQVQAPTRYIAPDEMVRIAIANESIGICYTYSEPLIWFEYILDTGKLAHERGLVNVLVTNGMINADPLEELLPYIDAANVDLKSMDPDFYRKVVKGNLDTVKHTIKRMKEAGVHVEVTNLMIPGYNDRDEDIKRLVEFVASVGDDTPLHFTRYFPYRGFDAPMTPINTLKHAYELAKQQLKYVYIGNVDILEGSNTYCPECGNLLVERFFYSTQVVGVSAGKCTKCGRKVDIVM